MKTKEETAATTERVAKNFEGHVTNVNVSKGRLIFTLDCNTVKCSESGEEETTNTLNVGAKFALLSIGTKLAKMIALKLDDFSNEVQLNPSIASIFIGASIKATREKYLAGEKNPVTEEVLTRNVYHTSALKIMGVTDKEIKEVISDLKILGESVTIRTISDVELIRM